MGWSSFEYLDAVRAMGISPNLAWFAGHSTVRARGVMGARVTPEQRAEMASLVREAMEQEPWASPPAWVRAGADGDAREGWPTWWP